MGSLGSGIPEGLIGVQSYSPSTTDPSSPEFTGRRLSLRDLESNDTFTSGSAQKPKSSAGAYLKAAFTGISVLIASAFLLKAHKSGGINKSGIGKAWTVWTSGIKKASGFGKKSAIKSQSPPHGQQPYSGGANSSLKGPKSPNESAGAASEKTGWPGQPLQETTSVRFMS